MCGAGLGMKQRTKLIVFGGLMAVWSAFAIPVAMRWTSGLGSCAFVSEWNASGRRLAFETTSFWGQRDGLCYYWGVDGQLDLGRSGWFDSNARIRALSPEEIESCNPATFVVRDLDAILFAESIVHCRKGSCVTDSELFADKAWADATGKHNPRPLDPWGRPYVIALAHLGTGVSVACLGRDGIEGGTGEDADMQLAWDVSMGHKGGENW